jgi:hypothetical protein
MAQKSPAQKSVVGKSVVGQSLVPIPVVHKAVSRRSQKTASLTIVSEQRMNPKSAVGRAMGEDSGLKGGSSAQVEELERLQYSGRLRSGRTL